MKFIKKKDRQISDGVENAGDVMSKEGQGTMTEVEINEVATR